MTSNEDEKKGLGLYSVAPDKVYSSTAVLTEPKPCKEPKTTDVDPEILCGLGSWTPEWIQKAASPKLFLFFYSMSGLTQGASFTYFVGCISTMEKRYAYDTKKSGLIMITDELAPIMFGILIGYFGGLANRPKLLTFGMIIGALSSFIMALPYFMYGSGRFDENLNRPSSRIAGVNSQFCDSEFNDVAESCSTAAATTAVTIFALGNFFKGVSGVIFYTIGTSYVDDSIKKKNSPLYLSK